MKPRIPTEAQIVEEFHRVASLIGRYDADDCVSHAIEQLTPRGADDDLRETISGVVRKAWLARMHVWGAA